MISRLLFVCLLIVSVGGVACEKRSLQAREEHVLNRIGYGPDPWSRQRIRQLGIDAYIEEQLYPARLDDSALEASLSRLYPSLTMSLAEIHQRYDVGIPRRHLAHAKLLRAVKSKRQLEQVLVDFWFDHFNVDARRPEIGRWAIVPYERDAIRPHVLGRFENMLRAVARHPAMLEYLDNAQNVREGYAQVRGLSGLNENFARELLELHTVGPDAGQTIADIRATAAAFTGWTVAENLRGIDGRGFLFVPAAHDTSQKRILTLTLPAGGGLSDGDTLIHYLANHPHTALHIATKLCRRFVSETPSGCELRAAMRFLTTQGDLREVMREILTSPEFHDPRNFRAKIKRPLHMVASTARALGVVDDEAFAHHALIVLSAMGEPLYGVPAPNGLPDVSSAWLGEGAMLERFTYAFRATSGHRGTRPPADLGTKQASVAADRLVQRLLLGGIAATTRNELIRFLNTIHYAHWAQEGTAFVLASPDFARH